MLLRIILLLPASLSLATSTFKVGDPTTHACPGPFEPQSPYYADRDDCACYFVCFDQGRAVRMCCSDGTWYDEVANNCNYITDFSTKYQNKCLAKAKGIGTTIQLREIFIGRCWEYQKFLNPSAFTDGYIDCQRLFDTFAKAWVGRAPCGEVKSGDYDKLTEQTTIALPADSQLFWSGTYPLAQEYADLGRRAFTLESTLIGYILNDVTWCGQKVDPKSPGINFDSCPAFASCPDHVMASFWSKALEKYASQAQGEVTVLLNGSRTDGPAFRNNSFFAEHEFPNLDPEKVTLIRVWLAHDLYGTPIEKCTSHGSVMKFVKMAEARNFTVECQDNPPVIRHMLCSRTPSHPSCMFYGGRGIQPFDLKSLLQQYHDIP